MKKMKIRLFYLIIILIAFPCVPLVMGQLADQIDQTESLVPPENFISDYDARLALARTLSYQQTRQADALVQYEILLRENPSNIELQLEKSQIYIHLKNYHEALATLYSALAKNPENIKLLLAAAQAEMAIGHYVKGQFLIQKILCLDEKSDDRSKDLLTYANMMMMWGDFYKAEKIYRDALEWLRLGEALSGMLRYEEAENLYKKLLITNPDNSQVLKALVSLKNSEKDFDAALDYADLLLELSPENPEYILLQANILYLKGCFEEALKAYELLKNDKKLYVQASIGSGRSLENLCRDEEALQSFRDVLINNPSNVEAKFYLAGKAVEEEDYLNHVIQATTNSQELEEWANVYIENGMSEIAAQLYRAALNVDPDNFPAKIGLADMLGVNYSFEPALEIYRSLLEDFPQDYKLMISIARVLGWSKQYQESITRYDDIIILNPNDPVPLREEARTALWGKMYCRAMEAYNSLVALVDQIPENDQLKQSILLEIEAKQLVWNKQYLHAIPVFEEQVVLNPGNEDALYEYAQNYCTIGRCDCARQIYNRILDIDPNHSLVKKSLERNLILSHMSLHSHFAYWRELGSGTFSQSQIARYELDQIIEKPLTCRSHLRFIQHEWVENPFLNFKFYPAEGQSIEVDYLLNNYLKGSSGVTYKNYFNKFKSRFTAFIHCDINILDYAQVSLGVDKKNEIYNFFCLKEAIQSTASWITIKSNFTRYWNSEGTFRFLNYNDHNTQVYANLMTQYSFTEDPTNFKIILNGYYYNTAHITIPIMEGTTVVYVIHPYWTPKKYFLGSVTLAWRHSYNKLEFCEAPQRYVDLKLSSGDDTSNNPFIEFSLEWKHDFAQHWGFELKGMIHRSPLWNAEGAWASLSYRF